MISKPKPYNHSLLSALLLCLSALPLSLTPQQAEAATVSISCPDIDDPRSCSISPNDNFGFEYIATLVENVNTCRVDDGSDSLTCDAGDLGILTCDALNDTEAECQLPDGSELSCNYDEDASTASCTLSTEAALANLRTTRQELNLSQPQAAVFDAMAETCLSRSGTSEFQNDCDAILAAARSNHEGLSEALAQLTPHSIAAAFDSLQTTLEAQNRNLTSRLEMLRSMVKQKPALDQAKQEKAQQAQAQVEGGNAGSDPLSNEFLASSRLSTFINGTTLDGSKSTTALETGSDWGTEAVTAGADYRFRPNLSLGVAFGLTNTSTTLDSQRGDLDNQSFNITGYGSYFHNERFYIDGTITFASSEIEQDRNIQFTLPDLNVDQTASARYFGQQFEITLGAGYEWVYQAMNINTFGQLAHREFDVDDYEESLSNNSADGAGLGFKVDELDISSLLLSVGTQFSYAFSQNWGLIMPTARFEYKTELKDDDRSVRVQFTDDLLLQQGIDLDLNPVDSSYFQIGLGVTAVLTNGQFGYLFWQTTEGFENFDQDTLTLGWRWEI